MNKALSVKSLLVWLAGFIVILHIANGINFARNLPNCARSYDEAMNSEYSTFSGLIQRESGYAPLYDTQAYIISRVVGKRWTPVYMGQNSIFLVMLVVALVLLGRKIADAETGLIAAIILCLYPLVAGAYNSYCMDFPLMGIMTLSVFLTIKSGYFQDPRRALWCGIVMLYGVMIKEPFAVYMSAPLLISSALGLRDVVADGDLRRLRNAGLCAVSIAVIVSAYFGWGFTKELFWDRLFMETPASTGLPVVSFPYMVRSIWQSQVSLPFFILFIVGAVFFQIKAPQIYRRTVWLWVFIPAVVIYVMPHHFKSRYFLPALPAFALMTAFGLRPLLEKRAIRWLAVPVIVVMGALQIYALEKDLWGINSLRIGARKYLYQFDLPLALKDREAFCALGEPIARALVRLAAASGSETGQMRFTVFPDDWSSESRFIHSYSIMNGSIRMDELQKARMVIALVKTGKFPAPPDMGFLIFILPDGKKMDIDSAEYAGMFLTAYQRYCRHGYAKENPDVVKELPRNVHDFMRLFEPAENVAIPGRKRVWIFRRKPRTV